jgi:hypothetical protein
MFIVELVLVILMGMVGVGDDLWLSAAGFLAIRSFVPLVLGQPWLGVPSLRRGKDNRIFVAAGLGLCLWLWLHYRRSLAAEGNHDDERCLRFAADL